MIIRCMVAFILCFCILVLTVPSSANTFASGSFASAKSDNYNKSFIKIDVHEQLYDSPFHFCKIENDEDVFDTDNVTLSLSFGSVFPNNFDERIKTEGKGIPRIEIYAVLFNRGDYYLLKEINENYIPGKYECFPFFEDPKSEFTTNVIFNHTEEITLSKDLISAVEGVIHIIVVAPEYFSYTEPVVLSYASFSFTHVISPNT